jgi:hypothetical protein
MKRNILIYPAGLLLALTCLTLNTCSNPEEEEPVRETPVTPVTPVTPAVTDPEDDEPIELPEYVFLDKCDELGEWDAAVFGLNSMAYLYKFKDDNPSKLVIWDGENDLIQNVVLFDRDGLPAMMLAGEYSFVMTNYRRNTFDLAILYNGEIVFADSIESAETDWDEYRAGNISLLSTRAAASNASIARKTVAGVGFVIAAIAAAPIIAAAVTGTATAGVIVGGALAATSVVLSGINAVKTFVCDECAGNVGSAAAVAGVASGIWKDGQKITLEDIKNGRFKITLKDIKNGLFSGLIEELVGNILVNAGESMDKKIADQVKANIHLFLRVDATVIEIERESADVILSALYVNQIDVYVDHMELMEGLQTIGICLNTAPNPTIGSRTIDHTMEVIDWNQMLQEQVAIARRKPVTDLKPNTTYYYRSYYNYNGRIFYGEDRTFKTKNIVISLVSPATDADVKPGESVEVTFRCIDENGKPVFDRRVDFESVGGSTKYSYAGTDENGLVSVTFTPNKKGASLTAKVYDENKLISECTFGTKFDIVGVWVSYNSAQEWGSRNILTFYSDGTCKIQANANAYSKLSPDCFVIYPMENYTGVYEVIDNYAINIKTLTAGCIALCVGDCTEAGPEMFMGVYSNGVSRAYAKIGKVDAFYIFGDSQIYGSGLMWNRLGVGSTTKSAIVPSGSASTVSYITGKKNDKRIVIPEKK